VSQDKHNIDTDELVKPSAGNAAPSGTGTHAAHRREAELDAIDPQARGVEAHKSSTPAYEDGVLPTVASGEAVTGDQAERLRILSSEAGEAFKPSLTRAEADRRIRDLQRRAEHRA
jgi:hypothetical protein